MSNLPLRKPAAVFTLLAFASSIGAQDRPAPAPKAAPEKIDYAALDRFRAEGRNNSQIMKTMHYLTDVHGPRLTGSPNYKAAAEWVVKQTTAWGFENAKLEPWDFGRVGWLNERFSGHIVAPVKDALVGEVLAWTPGTKGTVRAKAVRIEAPRCAPAPQAAGAPAGRGGGGQGRCPTLEEANAAFEKLKPVVKGAMVLVGAPAKVAVTLNPPATREEDEATRRRYDLDNPAPSPFGGPAGPNANPSPSPSPSASPAAGRLTANRLSELLDEFLVTNGAVVRVNDAGREHGQIRAFNNRTFDVTKVVPTVILRNEDYGRISRLVDNGASVELEFTIVNQVYPEGKTSYNVVAEIPGTDKKDEVVMLGGHLDSWHAATGATDNAIGCAVMLEAARIIKASGLKPRRTIRVGLWGGEEQGLLGSKAYVKEHFGTFENPKPGFGKFNGYFNVDSGTGRIRGASVFGPKTAAAIVRDYLAPFEDFGLAGAITSSSRRSGGTDHTSFNEAGLPGIGLGQDPIQYNSHTWHTNLDTYERIVEEDVIRSAIAIAGAVYHVAMRDEMLPRFTKETMPAPPPAPSPSPSPSPVPAATPNR